MSYNPLRKLCLKFQVILTTGGKFGTNGLMQHINVYVLKYIDFDGLFTFFVATC